MQTSARDGLAAAMGMTRLSTIQQYATPYEMMTHGSLQEYAPAMGSIHSLPAAASVRGLSFFAIASRLTRGEFIWACTARESEYAAINEWAMASMQPDQTSDQTAQRVYTTAELNRHLADLQLQGSFTGPAARDLLTPQDSAPRYRSVQELLSEVPFYCLGCISDCQPIGLNDFAKCSLYGPIYPGESMYHVKVTNRGIVENARSLFDPVVVAGSTLYALLTRVPTTTRVGSSFLSLKLPANPDTGSLFDNGEMPFAFPTAEPPDTRTDPNAVDYVSVYDVHPRYWIYQVILYSSCSASRVFGLNEPCLFDRLTGTIDCARVVLGTALTSSPVEAADALEPPFLRAARHSKLMSLPDLALRYYRSTHPNLAQHAPLFRLHVCLGSMRPEPYCNLPHTNDAADMRWLLDTANTYKFRSEPNTINDNEDSKRQVPVLVAAVTETSPETLPQAGGGGSGAAPSRPAPTQTSFIDVDCDAFKRLCSTFVDSLSLGPLVDRIADLPSLYEAKTDIQERIRSHGQPSSEESIDRVERIYCDARTRLMMRIASIRELGTVNTTVLYQTVGALNRACAQQHMYCACHFKENDAELVYSGGADELLLAASVQCAALCAAAGTEFAWSCLFVDFAMRNYPRAYDDPLYEWSAIEQATRTWHADSIQTGARPLDEEGQGGYYRTRLNAQAVRLRAVYEEESAWNEAWNQGLRQPVAEAIRVAAQLDLSRMDVLPDPSLLQECAEKLGRVMGTQQYQRDIQAQRPWATKVDTCFKDIAAAIDYARLWNAVNSKATVTRRTVNSFFHDMLKDIETVLIVNDKRPYPYPAIQILLNKLDKIPQSWYTDDLSNTRARLTRLVEKERSTEEESAAVSLDQ